MILNYRAGLLPILAPLTLLKHYLAEYRIATCRRRTILTPTRRIWPAPDGELRMGQLPGGAAGLHPKVGHPTE